MNFGSRVRFTSKCSTTSIHYSPCVFSVYRADSQLPLQNKVLIYIKLKPYSKISKEYGVKPYRIIVL